MIKILIIDDDTTLQEALNTKLKHQHNAAITYAENYSIAKFNYLPDQIQVLFFLDQNEALEHIKQASTTCVAKRDYELGYDLILIDLKFDMYDYDTTSPLETSGYAMLVEYNNLVSKVLNLSVIPQVDIITSMPLTQDDILEMRAKCKRIQLKNTQHKGSEVVLKRIFEFIKSV